jgi:aspartate kinase
MKFGGSSLESATALQRVVSIVNSFRDESPVVVVSAMGKTTDRLLKAATLAAEGKSRAAHGELYSLERFHLNLLESPAVTSIFQKLSALLDRLSSARELSPMHSDEFLSYGERLSSLIFANALGAVHLPAEKLIVTNNNHTSAAPLQWETYAKLRRAIPTNRISVLGGFIGATESGVPTTLGRGGSDFTAALVGAAINAEEIQIWTDVDGMLSCDPRVTHGGRCLRSISYAEAFEMAEWGAKVLHPATVAPAVRQRIPISIRNSRNATHPGTLIGATQSSRYEGIVKSIACIANAGVEKEQSLAAISLVGKGIERDKGLLSHAIKTLAARSVPFYSLATAPMRITFKVATQEMQLAVEALHEEFIKFQENGPYYREFETQRAHQQAARSVGRALTPAYS